MKTNELMIGDWVLDGNVYAQVTSITCDGNVETTHNEYSNIELIEPIQLTPEILEKNWFRKISEGRFLLEDSEDLYWVKFYPKDTNYTCGAYDYIDLESGCISIREMPIEFVHDLQHAMRICGIEKEIEL